MYPSKLGEYEHALHFKIHTKPRGAQPNTGRLTLSKKYNVTPRAGADPSVDTWTVALAGHGFPLYGYAVPPYTGAMRNSSQSGRMPLRRDGYWVCCAAVHWCHAEQQPAW